MTPEKVQHEYHRKAAAIEEAFAYRHVSPEVRNYYLLVQFIYLRSIRKYLDNFGLEPVDRAMANDGKEALGWGGLSSFEIDCVRILTRELEREEREGECSPVIPLARRIRTIDE